MNNFLKANEFYNSKNYFEALCYYEKAIEKKKMKHIPIIMQEYVI